MNADLRAVTQVQWSMAIIPGPGLRQLMKKQGMNSYCFKKKKNLRLLNTRKHLLNIGKFSTVVHWGLWRWTRPSFLAHMCPYAISSFKTFLLISSLSWILLNMLKFVVLFPQSLTSPRKSLVNLEWRHKTCAVPTKEQSSLLAPRREHRFGITQASCLLRFQKVVQYKSWLKNKMRWGSWNSSYTATKDGVQFTYIYSQHLAQCLVHICCSVNTFYSLKQTRWLVIKNPSWFKATLKQIEINLIPKVHGEHSPDFDFSTICIDFSKIFISIPSCRSTFLKGLLGNATWIWLAPPNDNV